MSPLPASIPPTHLAIVLSPSATSSSGPTPVSLLTTPTLSPLPGEALIHVTWTASSPVDLHRAAGGLLGASSPDAPPFILGCSLGGVVAALGDGSSHLAVGDEVFAFVQDGEVREAGFQEWACVPLWRVSRLTAGVKGKGVGMEEAVGVSCNLVTAVEVIGGDLGLELPWPKPEGWTPPEAGELVLVWGAASSVGMYVLQVLKYWGYENLVAVASKKHHETLKGYGARACFDYRQPGVVEEILAYVESAAGSKGAGQPKVPFIVDCIGSVEGTLRPLTQIAEPGAKVAIMLPVIKVHAGEGQASQLEMDVSKVLTGEWKEGVELKGTRTFLYAKNEFLKKHLQPEIVPALLEQGVVEPNKVRVVEGKTLLERAQRALDLLRDQAVSGERLVWRVAEE